MAHRALQHELPKADLVAAAEKAGQVIWERGLLKKVHVPESMLCWMLTLGCAAGPRHQMCREAGGCRHGCHMVTSGQQTPMLSETATACQSVSHARAMLAQQQVCRLHNNTRDL